MGPKYSIPVPPNDREVRRKKLQLDKLADLPEIPYLKLKDIKDDLAYLVRTSIWIQNYKRAFRGQLRTDPNRNDAGTLYTIHVNSVSSADLLGLPKDSYAMLIEQTIEKFGPIWVDDARDHLKERGKIKANMKETSIAYYAECTVGDVQRQMADQVVHAVGKRMYGLHNAGQNIDQSDDEMTPVEREKHLKLQEKKRLDAAAERQKQASKWKTEASKLSKEDEKRQKAVLAKQEEKKLREKRKLEEDTSI